MAIQKFAPSISVDSLHVQGLPEGTHFLVDESDRVILSASTIDEIVQEARNSHINLSAHAWDRTPLSKEEVMIAITE